MKRINIFLGIFLIIVLLAGCSRIGYYSRRSGKPKIAFIIDDVGYHGAYKRQALAIKAPITYAVIPHTNSAKQMAKYLHSKGNEIILHLPMEASNRAVNKEKGMIFADMPDQEVLFVLRENIKSVPYVKGVNNHKGSKGTSNRRVMRVILKELKKKRLYFVDSVTSGTSVCSEVADQLRMRIGRRDVFLDNKKDMAYIKQQIAQLKRIALKNGSAIGIGHYHKVTLTAIAESINELKRSGIEIVLASEII